MIQYITFPVGLLECNCTILYDEKTREACIIDPGGDEEKILKEIQKRDLKPKYLLHTHAHFDHIMATPQIVEKFPDIEVLLHEKDLFLWESVPIQGSFFGTYLPPMETKIQHFLEDEEEISLGENKIKTLHTPGHTPGSVSFYLELPQEALLFSGDTLFKGSIGRTDLWGGDYYTLMASIKNRFYPLDEDTKVIPGHGEFTRLGVEKRTNPYL